MSSFLDLTKLFGEIELAYAMWFDGNRHISQPLWILDASGSQKNSCLLSVVWEVTFMEMVCYTTIQSQFQIADMW